MAVRDKLGIEQKEFKQRREKVLKHLNDGKTIIYSGSQKVFSNDVHYPFRADSNFYYLTGFNEPDSALVLDPNSKTPYTLYLRPRDPEKEIWEGYREGLEGAKRNFHADKSLDSSDMPLPKNSNIPDGFRDVSEFIYKMRSIKSPAEIDLMRESNRIAQLAHRTLKDHLTPGIYEYELQGVLEAVFKSNGASNWAYPPIVASGKNSCILHYIENNKKIEEKDLVLVDAGCEFQFYASDITRTLPANGQFTRDQQDIYDLVLAAQEKAIEVVKPGNTFGDFHNAACEVLSEGLQGLGYIKDKNNPDELKKYFMHGTGHSLGIDVHDLGVYDSRKERKTAEFTEGMCLTVEPGIYVPERAIGVRLEDNLVVTKNGFENLTETLDK